MWAYSMIFGFTLLVVTALLIDEPATSASTAEEWQITTGELPNWVGGAWLAGLAGVVWLVGFRLPWSRGSNRS